MKYLTIPIIALGLTLSCTIGIEYNCSGSEMFPTYYGSPFIFKMKSLGASMEFYYNVFGLTINIGVWSIVVAFIRYSFLKLIGFSTNKLGLKKVGNIFAGLLLIFALVNIYSTYIQLGRGFDKNLNYWFWNLNKEAKDWGVKCEGEWKIMIL